MKAPTVIVPAEVRASNTDVVASIDVRVDLGKWPRTKYVPTISYLSKGKDKAKGMVVKSENRASDSSDRVPDDPKGESADANPLVRKKKSAETNAATKRPRSDSDAASSGVKRCREVRPTPLVRWGRKWCVRSELGMTSTIITRTRRFT